MPTKYPSLLIFCFCLSLGPAWDSFGCELCAIYGADNARGGSSQGLQLTVSQQYISYRTIQYQGEVVQLDNPEYLEESITHLVPSYNFNQTFGISANIPYIHRDYKRYTLDSIEEGSVQGFGDASLIGRVTVFNKAKMNYSVSLNLLGGIKFPTGDTAFLRAEADESNAYTALFGPGHEHGVIPLLGGVHYHNVAVGSGSYDGTFGANFNSRWRRVTFSSQFQYYLRTRGESTFEYGDALMVSGGPGVYLVSNDKCTINLQLNALYATESQARLFGVESDQTGMAAKFLGPQLAVTVGKHFTSIAGVDIPMQIRNHGLQNVPDYQIHGSVTWRF